MKYCRIYENKPSGVFEGRINILTNFGLAAFRWFDFMGSVRNTYAPFNIFYRQTNESFDGSPTTPTDSPFELPFDDLGITPYDGDTYFCNTPPPVSSS